MAICVDHNKQGHILWKITKQDDGNYRIKILDEDTKFGVNASGGLYKNAYMGVNEGETGVNPVLDTNMAGFENGQLDWKLRNDPRVVSMERTNFRYSVFSNLLAANNSYVVCGRQVHKG